MSNPFSDNNPYSSPDPKAFDPTPSMESAEPWTIDYFGGFNRIMANPAWFVNILCSGLCFGVLWCIIVGPIVGMGYMYLVVEYWHRTRGERYPDFDFNKFGEYLTRGLGPFLIALASGVVQWVAQQIVMIPIHLSAAGAGQGQEPDPAVMLPFILLGVGMSFAIQIAFGFIVWPMQIRGGLSNDVGQTFNLGWALGFVSKMWVEMIIAMIVSGLVGFAICMLGYLALCIGIIPAVGFVQLFNAWLSFQLYRMYLSRGGEPIPLKPLMQPL